MNITRTLFILLILLIILSGFFSCAETALMAINRYRMRHEARLKKRSALLILKLLKRPDRLLGVVLIGNTLASVASSAIVTILTVSWWGEHKVWLTTLLLTVILLVFSEAAPKTLAALYPDQVSRIIVFPIYVLRQLFYPFIWSVNVLANSLLRLVGVHLKHSITESLSHDELRSLVYETTGKIPHRYQNMLLGLLDLKKLSVDDVMISRRDIHGLDLSLPWPAVYDRLSQLKQDWVPVYRESVNQLLGILQMSSLSGFLLLKKELSAEQLIALLKEPYFIPEQTPLNIQLHNFQENREQVAFVVDEYGEVIGLLTLDDILEEIVGEFTFGITGLDAMMTVQPDGSYLVDGMLPVREFNRFAHWDLPTPGPRTINGLITEYLEALPRKGTGVLIARYPIEIMEVRFNRVKLARIFPRFNSSAR